MTFAYQIIFTVELIVGELVFVSQRKKKKLFAVRLLSFAIILLISIFLPVVSYGVFFVSLNFILIFALSLMVMKFCLDESWWNILFYGLLAYTIQHLAYVICSLLNDLFNLDRLDNGGIPIDLYNAYGINYLTVYHAVLYTFMYIIGYFSVYWAAYFIFRELMRDNNDFHISNKALVIAVILIVISNVITGLITVYNTGGNYISRMLEYFYNAVICLLCLYLLFSQLNAKEMKNELETMNRIIYNDQKQYELIKQNIDIINIKCHDLKHQVHKLRERNSVIDDDELAVIESAITIYNSVIKTGNEALDVILTDKSLACEEKGIDVISVVDGKKLDFMKNSDIYSLFGNILDNAIEAVTELDRSKRIINLQVRQVANLVSVHADNYFGGVVEMVDGLPKTKKDRAYHGFGMLSIKAIAEKYGGIVAVDIKNNIFNLNIMFSSDEFDE